MGPETRGPRPLITVAMSVRNNGATVSAAIASILAQTCGDFEFIIVNDGSSDDTAAKIARFADPRIQTITYERSEGLAARLNEIVALANGEFIARMDGDDFSYPERFERQLAFMRANPQINLAGAGAVVFRSSGVPIGAFRNEVRHEAISARPEAGFGVPHPTWFGQTSWFRANPYATDVQRAEDQVKLLSAYRKSRFGNVPEPLLGYRQDIPKIVHITQSRLPYLRAVAQQGAQSGEWGLIGRAMVQQLGRTAVTVTELALGRGERVLARRFRPLTNDERTRFIAVRDGLFSNV